MSITIEVSKPDFSGNSMVKMGLNDGGTIVADYNNWDYYIVMINATEWEIKSGTDEMSINPATYDTSPHVAKIVLTESGGAITDAKYYVNNVEVTPSFSFTERGSIGKTGFTLLGSYNSEGNTKAVLNRTQQSYVNLSNATITTTSHTDDTQVANANATQYTTVDDSGPSPSVGGTRFPPPPIIIGRF